METHSSILAWKIAWTEEPGEIQYMGSQRVGYNWSRMQLYNQYYTFINVFLNRVICDFFV